MRRKLLTLILVTFVAMLFVVFSFSTAFASSHSSIHQVTSPQVNVTGRWKFTTTDPGFGGFRLNLVQTGTRLRGHDAGGERVTGSVNGNQITFTVHGVSSEDDYGGQGTIGPGGFQMSGSFWDGFGGTGTFAGHKV